MSGGQHSSTGTLIGLEGVANTNLLYFCMQNAQVCG